MRIEPIGRVRCQTSLWRSGGVLRLTAITKATFAFADDDVARQLDPVAIGLRDKHFDQNPRRSTFESFEVAPYIPVVGITLVGAAHPPEDRATSSMSVRLCVYDDDTPLLEKTLHVFGERSADDPRVSKTLTTMPLVYERAIGGRENLAGSSLYNIVSPEDASRPGCFAPVPLAWRALGGRGLDPHAMKASPIEIPDGFDFGFFCAAPYDQRLRSLGGNEWLLLDGMSVRAPRMQTRLPGASARALFRSRVATVWGAPVEIPLMLDTITIDAEDESFSLLFRGHAAIDDRAEDLYVLAGIDLPDAPLAWPGARGEITGTSSAHPSLAPRVPGEARGPGPSAELAGAMSSRPAAATERPKSSAPPALEDQGGIFETVVGTLDEILASMPALPFEPAAPAERVEPSSGQRPVPATPWDVARTGDALPSSRAAAFDVEETMDVTASRRLLTGEIEDQGTVVGDVSPPPPALPFSSTAVGERVRPAPLGVPRALPFDDAPREPVVPSPAPAMARPQRAKAQTLHSATNRPLPPPFVRPPASVEVRTIGEGDRATNVASNPSRPSRTTTQEITLPTAPAAASPAEPNATQAAEAPLASASGGSLGPLEAEESATDTTAVVVATVGDAASTSPSAGGALASLDRDKPALASGAAPSTPPAPHPSTETEGASAPSRSSSPDVEASPRDSVVMGPPDAAAKLRKEVQTRLSRNESLSDLALAGVNLAGLDLTGRNLSGLDLTGANLTRCVLRGARLSRTKLEGALLSFAAAEEVDLENADLRRATLEGARFAAARLSFADFTLASAHKASFEGVTGRGARFVGAKLDGADFSRADLVEVDLTKAQASKARFEGARLVDGTFSDMVAESTNFDRADLTRGAFGRAVLRRAYFVGTNAADANLENADLSGARCSRAILDRANLERATLDGADLTGASLQKAVLKGVAGAGARFDGARLDEADLRSSKLTGASLVGATLVGAQAGRADLSKANLSKANLENASFRNARLAESKLVGAIVDKADFRDAHLVRADLSGIDRESARFAGANLDGVEGFTSG